MYNINVVYSEDLYTRIKLAIEVKHWYLELRDMIVVDVIRVAKRVSQP